jgi:hypothetical protein
MEDNEAKLEFIKSSIESMGKQQHIEVLGILKKHENVTINENRNGVYINLSFLPEDVVCDLENYIRFIQEQEQNLSSVETQKKEFEKMAEVAKLP